MNEPHSKQQAYAQLIDTCKKSNLTVSNFCQQNKIRQSTYYYWQKKLKKSIAKPIEKQSSRFVPVQIKPSYAQNTMVTDRSSVSINLPSDVTITFSGSDIFTHSIGRVILSNTKIV